MSHVTLAHKGLAAIDARNWQEGIDLLTKALQTSPNPGWLIARSKALIITGHFREALDDADLAWHIAYERNKRPQIAEAHHRRAVAYYRLGELANADCCCKYAMRIYKGGPALEKGDASAQWTDERGLWTQTREDAVREAQDEHAENQSKSGGAMGLATGGGENAEASKGWRAASTLRIQILTAMAKLSPDDPARKPTAQDKPERKKLSDLKSSTAATTETKPAAEAQSGTASSSSSANKTAAPPKSAADAPLRLQDFQSTTNMSVSIFSKGIDKDAFKAKFLPFSVELDPVVYPNGDQRPFTLNLWGEIDPAESKCTITPNKVELSLRKKTPGKWPTLQGEAKASGVDDAKADKDAESLEFLKQARQKAMKAAESAAAAAPAPSEPTKDSSSSSSAAAAAKGPAYPTSSRTGPKDWDKITEDDDEEEQHAVNDFFKKIYKDATPDAQRAMMKSFTESNGTSLSTDWNDVKDRKVDTVPPEGVEAKKW
jgi:suppressor of G2 allele of SKP1